MMDALEINRKYEPLFFSVPGVRYYIVTGGRGSAKSFTGATAINYRTYDDSYNVLFTRLSMTSADISVIPEFTEKMQTCHNAVDFYTKSAEIVNLTTGATIFFRGILQSRKNNDARLKSVPNVKIWVVDEAQELDDEDQFDTIDLSIRTAGANNEVWMFMNPSDMNSWIYKRFFEGPGVPDDFNGVKGDVCYIHTTYLENLDHLNDTFIAQAEKMKAANYEKYRNIFLGYWKRFKEGLIYKNWKRNSDADMMTRRDGWWYGIDWGFTNDPTALVRIWRDSDTGRVWVFLVAYERGLLTGQIARRVREDIIVCSQEFINSPMPPEVMKIEDEAKRKAEEDRIRRERTEEAVCSHLIYCDPARPEHIQEFRRVYNLNACPGDNRDKPGRVDWLKGCEIWYDGDAIQDETEVYCYLPSKVNPKEFTNVPQDGNDHAMDATNYGVVTHLRRQGIPNDLGEV